VTTADQFVAELVSRYGLVSAADLEQAGAAQVAAADEFGQAPSLAEILLERGLVAAGKLSALQAEELGLPVRPLTGRWSGLRKLSH
jgi:hypothetical protein